MRDYIMIVEAVRDAVIANLKAEFMPTFIVSALIFFILMILVIICLVKLDNVKKENKND